MALYRVSKDELLSKLSEDVKKPVTERDVFKSSIKLSLLKKIDRIFEKGLVYYIDPSEPVRSENESIFFRKDRFNATLNLESRRLVNRSEEDKLSFISLSKLIDYKIERKFRVYGIGDKSKEVASEIRDSLNLEQKRSSREFLKSFIEKLAEFNILVFEFIEVPQKKEKTNIKGMFLAPNVIVLKRNQDSLKQEIFTLAHELGHYLLNKEEIDDTINVRAHSYQSSNSIEKWCSDFAYYLLAGEYSELIDRLEKATAENDYHHGTVDNMSDLTQLSRSAIYTRLLLNNVIAPGYYNKVIDTLDSKYLEGKATKKAKFEQEKLKAEAEGREIIIPKPKPIHSPLYIRTLKGALFNGLITERYFCEKLGIKPDKLEQYLV